MAKSRREIHAGFVARFHVGDEEYPPTLIAATQLDAVEAALETKLPTAYREFITRYGTVYTPIILERITEKSIDHPDIQDFLDPRGAIEGTQGYWSAGMPGDIIGIASDCMGNMIGFRRCAVSVDDAPVVFFDHDYVEVHEIAPSFDKLLAWYVDHL
jgi:hypothetical protein